MLSSIRQKFEQLIADAHMTFQGTRGARHGAQPRQKHHFLAKELMRKIGKKGIYSSILDRFQYDEVFSCKPATTQLDERMVRIFGLHQNNRYFAHSISRTIGTRRYVVSFSVRSETNGKRTHKKPSRLPPNYTSDRKHEQRSRSESRIKKTSQLPRGSGPREARVAYMALSQLEMVLRGKPNFRFKFHTMASTRISRSACLGKPRSNH